MPTLDEHDQAAIRDLAANPLKLLAIEVDKQAKRREIAHEVLRRWKEAFGFDLHRTEEEFCHPNGAVMPADLVLEFIVAHDGIDGVSAFRTAACLVDYAPELA